MTTVVSFGSLNMDLTVRVPRRPAPDETVIAEDLSQFLGGKGANQAIAAARLGATAHMVGCVGTDSQGDAILAGLARNGVGAARVRRVDGPSGTAIPIVVTEAGAGPRSAHDNEVSIIVVPGANATVSPLDADDARALLEAADVVLLQGEVDSAASERAALLARDRGALVVFNPAPVRPDAGIVALLADIVVANRSEAAALGVGTGGHTPLGGQLVLTLGAEGARVGDLHVGGYPARSVDPTGAGDAFLGALAVALGAGEPLVDAVRFANAAGACAVEVAGAEPSFPTAAAVAARQRARR